MPDIRVTLDKDNHDWLKKIAIDSGLTLRRLVELTLIDLINKAGPRRGKR
jgi:hypothetical protein